MKGSVFCALVCIVLTIVSYILFSNAPKEIRGDDKVASVVASENVSMYTVALQGIHFTKNSLASIQIVSIPSNQMARVEATYSKDLDEHGFFIDIDQSTISLSIDSDAIHPIKTFLITIYAPVNLVKANGSGYTLALQGDFGNTLSLYVSGDVRTNVTLNGNSNVLLASAGSSIVTVTGKAKNASIALSGSSSVYADQLVCSSATVSIAGSGKAMLCVEDILGVTLKGASSVEYWGSPQLVEKYIEPSSFLEQVSLTIPAFAMY